MSDNPKPKLTLKPEAKEKALTLLKEKGIDASKAKHKEPAESVKKEAIITQKLSEEEKQKRYLENLEYFSKKYPKCFTNKLQLLKINIHKDLMELEKENKPISLIRFFLRTYTRDPKYRKLIVLGAERIDLEGKVASKVEKEDIDKLQRRKTKANQQKKEKEPAPA